LIGRSFFDFNIVKRNFVVTGEIIKIKFFIYFFYFNLACECMTQFGAIDINCDKEDGQCRCKTGYNGRQCDKCGIGFHEFPYCKGEIVEMYCVVVLFYFLDSNNLFLLSVFIRIITS